MPDGAAHDFAQDVTAALVGGENAVSDEKGCGASVVGDDTERSGTTLAFFKFFFAVEIHAAEFCGTLHQRNKKVRVVVGDDALEDGRDALQPHPGIHAGLR